jgi:hypothetical protein
MLEDGGDETPVKSAEEKALVRKIDLYLMPSIWLLFLLAVSRLWCEFKHWSILIFEVHGSIELRQRQDWWYGGSLTSQ